jgi:hypothetical protein
MLPRARTEDVLVEAVGDELVIYDRQRHVAHRLNATAALVWRLADGGTPPERMASVLAAELHPLADEDLVRLTLDRLAHARLLDGQPEPSADQVRLSRRTVVRKVGVVGVLSLLLPAVTTLVTPTPLQANSPVTCDDASSDLSGTEACIQ